MHYLIRGNSAEPMTFENKLKCAGIPLSRRQNLVHSTQKREYKKDLEITFGLLTFTLMWLTKRSQVCCNKWTTKQSTLLPSGWRTGQIYHINNKWSLPIVLHDMITLSCSYKEDCFTFLAQTIGICMDGQKRSRAKLILKVHIWKRVEVVSCVIGRKIIKLQGDICRRT